MSNVFVNEVGLSAFQAYIQLCDVMECGAITGPPLDESLSDSHTFYLQFTLYRLNGRLEPSSEVSSVVIFRLGTDRALFRLAKAILKDMPTQVPPPPVTSLTLVPFSSEKFLNHI